jgi:hypothetical protein
MMSLGSLFGGWSGVYEHLLTLTVANFPKQNSDKEKAKVLSSQQYLVLPLYT